MLNTSKNGDHNPESLRREPRFTNDSKGLVTVIGLPTYGKYPATILDASRSALQLELNTPLQRGSQIKVECNDLIVIGEVVSGRSQESGCYRMDIIIRKVAASHRRREYQPEIDMSLHALDQVVREHRQTPLDEVYRPMIQTSRPISRP